MKVFKVEPNKKGYVKEIENTLDVLHQEIGGYIQICYLDDGLLAVVDEEGLIKNLEPNLALPRYGVIYGNVLFVRDDGKGDFESLTDKDITRLENIYGTLLY